MKKIAKIFDQPDAFADVFDMGAVPYSAKISNDGAHYFGTPQTMVITTVLRIACIIYVVYALEGFWNERQIQVNGNVKTRHEEEAIPPILLHSMGIKLLPGRITSGIYENNTSPYTLDDKYFTIWGGKFIFEKDGHVKIIANCSQNHDNFADRAIAQAAKRVADSIAQDMADTNPCVYTQENIIQGSKVLMQVLLSDLHCVIQTGGRHFDITGQTFIPSQNIHGYSKVGLSKRVEMFNGVWMQENYHLSTLHIHRHNKWYPFVDKTTETFAMVNGRIPLETLIDAKTFLESYQAEHLIRLYPSICAAYVVISLDSLIYEQEIWPQTILATLTRIGGFVSFLTVVGVLLKIYNSSKLMKSQGNADLFTNLEEMKSLIQKMDEKYQKEITEDKLDDEEISLEAMSSMIREITNTISAKDNIEKNKYSFNEEKT